MFPRLTRCGPYKSSTFISIRCIESDPQCAELVSKLRFGLQDRSDLFLGVEHSDLCIATIAPLLRTGKTAPHDSLQSRNAGGCFGNVQSLFQFYSPRIRSWCFSSLEQMWSFHRVKDQAVGVCCRVDMSRSLEGRFQRRDIIQICAKHINTTLPEIPRSFGFGVACDPTQSHSGGKPPLLRTVGKVHPFWFPCGAYNDQ